MGNANRLDGEWADGELFLGNDFDEGSFIQQVMLFELAFNVRQGEFGGVDGSLDLTEDPGQSADVVFMAVGQNDGANVLPVFNEIGDVRHHDIHTKQFRLGEHKPRVDHDNFVFPAHYHAVHSELAKAPKGYDFQFFSLHLSGLILTLWEKEAPLRGLSAGDSGRVN